MNPSEFCYWLQGWAELEGGKKPNLEQWLLIKAHLQLVFKKVTPDLETLLNQGDLGSFKEIEFPELKDLGLYDEKDLQERLPEEEQPIGPGAPYFDTERQEMIDGQKALEDAVKNMDMHSPIQPPQGGRPTHLDHLEKICGNESDDPNLFCSASADRLGRVLPRKSTDD